jgi:hypothetical protein
LAFGLFPELDHFAVLLCLGLLVLEVALANQAQGNDHAYGGQNDLVSFELHVVLLG